MPDDKSNDLPKIGYLFHHPDIGHPKDKFRLDIYLSSESTELHFDVLRASFLIRSPQDTVKNLKVLHPWEFEKKVRVCPGPVIMEDHKGKKEEAFSFGGDLSITLEESLTACSLESTAPILHISGGTKMDELFVQEVEILLAEKRAKIFGNQELKDLYCLTEPLDLYIACLVGLKEKIRGFKHGTEHYHNLMTYIETQEQCLAAAGLSEEYFQTFEDILKS